MEEVLIFSKQFATALFFTFFVIVLFRNYWYGRKEVIEEIRYSIFDEEELRGMQ